MKLFIDSAFFVALMDKSDKYHKITKDWFSSNADKFIFMTNNFVIAETITFLRCKVGYREAKEFGEKFRHSNLVKTEWMDIYLEKKAWELFQKYADKKDLSYVDCLSFACMKEDRISHALTFDKHFKQVGFTTLPLI
ncbi:hypothetical protein A2230_07830 [candidate division WOR-1 bacterium RIFOXYA2_FULL_36_21]|uniref:PIN domain-containing protein n=1 Tax=candidate division WOR-1 bacterium RIFOXYB2_FULL_36_35 TaxID=1802578 RepID=A0A1F4RYU4_UNCSA|nr:MAG: hypothetical protein A2230_07830 [candidate division WOR-1 bacterium RIFOXYA2_FULL_36_21]OGC13365.1 MAG: hypothetical protein A2290_02550 [candidate division WOR-1 bacterium RIFOXYB2_FULL_36_35]OGC15415.1 MAG: hypothetical protein A2282_08830 [candidate division WOR-1 bacterium RIFOXYA12_FULL_36_13]